MTYYVSSGTLNPTHSLTHSPNPIHNEQKLVTVNARKRVN